MIRKDKGRNEARTRSKKSEKRLFNLCIQRLNHFEEAYQITLLNLSSKTKLENQAKVIPFTMFTYPKTNWYIRQRYIFQPLLLLQSVPCHHIASEMYLKPNRPQMHANSASRENLCL